MNAIKNIIGILTLPLAMFVVIILLIVWQIEAVIGMIREREVNNER